MSLLLPAFFSAAALVGLPLLLHLLRRQPRTAIAFPSLFFLGQLAVRDSRRQRIRRWLTLLLRCLLILLIVLAFCRPFWRLAHSETSRAVVVVVDNSFSMQAEGRRAAVEAWLAPQLASLRAPDQLGVLLLHPTPTWLVPLTDNLELGRHALTTLPQSYETSHYRAGIELAGAKLALSTLQQKQILLAADQQRSGWEGVRFERTLPEGVKLYPAPPAPLPPHQAALVALKATRVGEGRVAFDATVRAFTPATPAERTVSFYAGRELVGTQKATLTAGTTQIVRGEYDVPDARAALMLHATLDADALAVDDAAYTALPGEDDQRVIVTPASPGTEVDFLQLALEAGRSEKSAFHLDPLPAAGVAWPATTVPILRGAAPFLGVAAATLDTFIEAGGSAWIICDGSPEQAAWLAKHGVTVTAAQADKGTRLKLRDLQLEHPLFAPFTGHSIAPLLAPSFFRGWSLQGDAVEPLARWLDRTVAIAEVPTGGGRLLLTGFGETRADSTLPIEAAYVPLVQRAVVWLAQGQMAAPLGVRVGATQILPGAGTWTPVLSPKTASPIEVNGYVTPSVPGIYAFEQPNLPKRFYAVNIDPAESDLGAWPTPEDFTKLVAKEKKPALTPPTTDEGIVSIKLLREAEPVIDAALVDQRFAWWWLLLAAIIVMLLELALSNRTIP